MKFHVVSLAHTQTTRAYEVCAFTSNVRGFCRMMKLLGHEVILYASEQNDAPCDELVTCITQAEIVESCGVTGPENVGLAKYCANESHWRIFNVRATLEIRKRAKPGDFLCLSSGCQEPIAKALPYVTAVEFSAGYQGVLRTTNRVFPSQAWAHCIYTWEAGQCQGTQGRMNDRVIPHYFDPSDFYLKDKREPYLLFIGRLNKDKGYQIAIDTAKTIGVKLIVCGQGDPMPASVDYRGLVGIEERGKLMAAASAVFVPTLYLEPFGKVAVEALLSGAPIITTDWGAFPEINQHGLTGYRCRTPRAFVDAANACMEGRIYPRICRSYAVKKYSEEVICKEYQSYFEDLIEARPKVSGFIRRKD